MEKVKITQQQADLIQHLQSSEDNKSIVRNYALGNYSTRFDPVTVDMTFDDFVRALVNGCEVEQTPEEKVRGEHGKHWVTQSEWSVGYCVGIKMVLSAYNIKIEGVND